MSDEELEQEIELVKSVSKFLKEDQINVFIQDLKSGDGVPTDSQSMTDAMHRQGINMRYLGYIHKRLSEKQDTTSENEK